MIKIIKMLLSKLSWSMTSLKWLIQNKKHNLQYNVNFKEVKSVTVKVGILFLFVFIIGHYSSC